MVSRGPKPFAYLISPLEKMILAAQAEADCSLYHQGQPACFARERIDAYRTSMPLGMLLEKPKLGSLSALLSTPL